MEHTLIVIAGGLLLLGLCVFVGHQFAKAAVDRSSSASRPAGARRGAMVFLPIWFVGAFVNAAIGVSHGYTVAAEATVFLVVFGVPAAVALAISCALRRSTRGSPR